MSQTEVQLIKAAAVVTADIADQAVTLDKLPHGTSSNNGKFLRANNGADPTFETISSDVVGDTSPQLGGTLDLNGNQINGGDSNGSSTNIILLGAGNDLKLYHDGTDSYVQNATGDLYIQTTGSGDDIFLSAIDDVQINAAGKTGVKVVGDAQVELYHNNSIKFQTKSDGVDITGELQCDSLDVDGSAEFTGADVTFFGANYNAFWDQSASQFQIEDNAKIVYGSGQDLEIFHDGSNSYIKDAGTGSLLIRGSTVSIQSTSGEAMIEGVADGAVTIKHDNTTVFQTTSAGISVTGQVTASVGAYGLDANDYLQFTDNDQLNIYLNNNNEFRFEADGDFHADGDVIAFSTTVASDENLKDNITTITDAVTKVEAIKGVTYTWKKDNSQSAGVIAQDVQKVLPEVVKTVSNFDGNEYLAVNYGGLTSILIEAIKDLSARVKVLEAK